MAFDQATRNRLARFVGQARTLLSEEFTRQLQHDYGLDPLSGDLADMATLTHLDDAGLETARTLRQTLEHYLAGPSGQPTARACQAALERIVREQAYTVLNRLCALRMAEARGLLIESTAAGYQSKGFQLYARLAGGALGETGDAYRSYLFSLFDEMALDLAVLFDRFSPHGRLFPRETTLLRLLDEINQPELTGLWAEDETIGWIYQYFNSDEERRQMRKESQAPRNSRELAVRNQFFTPRYVVEFLTDNTLGRTWYEMTQGQTALVESCRYLVRRPNEIFLADGEAGGESGGGSGESGGMSQEELLRQPVYILYRPLKDPRDIKLLDPACGSMHFGLYAFDLFEQIYLEAWEMQASDRWRQMTKDEGRLARDYPTQDMLRRDIPRLIIEHNLHGVDIDPRAAQIAGLSLWLRAHKSWQALGLRPGQRPLVRRSNIVCAEPMPGDKAMLAEFTAGLQPKLLGQLVEIIFDKMALAGEAGSLLKIETEISDAVETALAAYREHLLAEKKAAGYLPGFAPPRPTTLFDFADLPEGEDFWRQAEEAVLAALEAYATAAEAGAGYRRRLFAGDAARGFAFIDVCRQRYDVVLMNPPFGESSKLIRSYMGLNYPGSKNDILGSFVEMGVVRLGNHGRLGAITARPALFLSSMERWRKEVLFNAAPIQAFVDLGEGILDSAMVKVAAYVLETCAVPTVTIPFFQVMDSTAKEESLQLCCKKGLGTEDSSSYWLSLKELELLPNMPLAYWTPHRVRKCFRNLHSLADEGIEVKQGLGTTDDFRFVRAAWEVPLSDDNMIEWYPYAKGGESQWFYGDIHLVVNWTDEGKEIYAKTGVPYGGAGAPVRNPSYYGQSGLTYTSYTNKGFRPRVLAAGCIFTTAGMGIFTPQALELLPLLNSSVVQFFLSSITDDRKWEVGYVQVIPIPHIDEVRAGKLRTVAVTCWEKIRHIYTFYEESPSFIPKHELFGTDTLQTLIDVALEQMRFAETYVFTAMGSIDAVVLDLYGLQGSDIELDPSSNENSKSDLQFSGEAILSFFLGSVFGRWDIRYATGEKAPPELPDPFDPLPVCSPGMLQNAAGLPAAPQDVPGDYPLRIAWAGVLVDDEGHAEDIERRLRVALELIWGQRAGEIEAEACQMLEVSSLRAYFAHPNRFFDDHLKRYSKSRRCAPIYWPLSTPSGAYTLWLYYHRLTDQTLYTCVNDFVEPKLTALGARLSDLRRQPGRSTQAEKEMERLADLELELRELRAELLRVAAFWKPNLNDGVQITAAPLWRLFQHRGWQKRLKETWEQLEAGEYDWAHLAYSLWPGRVRDKCKRDRSLAIAHGLEDVYEE